MLLPLLPKSQKRRKRRRQRLQANPTPPPSGNVIVAVVHHPTLPSVINVTLGSGVVSVGDPETALQVRTGIGPWIIAGGVIADGTSVEFDFSEDVSDCTEWRVLDPTAWQFGGGQHLDVPFEGSIA